MRSGVIDPIRLNSLVAAGREQVYVAHHQSPQRTMFPAVRAAGDPLALVGSVQAAVRSLEPDLPIFEVRLAGDYVAMATARTRLATIGLGLFAMLAVVLWEQWGAASRWPALASVAPSRVAADVDPVRQEAEGLLHDRRPGPRL